MNKLNIIQDEFGNNVVLIPNILFLNKQSINWTDVEEYLERYVDEIVEITETKDIVYIGNKFPNEYSGSVYTRKTKGARAKAKANAAQGIREMVEIATNRVYRENHKDKTEKNNIYSACLVVNHATNGKMYLYDVVNIKKEASNPLMTTIQPSGTKPLPSRY